MKPEDFARLAGESSPLLAPLHEYNVALRRRHAAAAYVEASTVPATGTSADCKEGWEGYRLAQEERRRVLGEAETALSFARRRAEAALGRTLTAEEGTRGFAGSCRPGVAGVPGKPEHLKPGRRLAEGAA